MITYIEFIGRQQPNPEPPIESPLESGIPGSGVVTFLSVTAAKGKAASDSLKLRLATMLENLEDSLSTQDLTQGGALS